MFLVYVPPYGQRQYYTTFDAWLWYNCRVKQVIPTIPAFEPDARLLGLVHRLKSDFSDIVIVNDGSHRADAVFAELKDVDGVLVLLHGENRGKGAALKTAFAEILRRFPDAVGTVTVDADGQHRPEDAVRIAEALCAHPHQLIIGTRSFGKGVPFRSRLGNLWTVAEFRLLTGRTVHDTQTGLRGIPSGLLPSLLNLPGERYDYEIGMLVRAVLSSDGCREIPIETVYEDGNRASHFRPLADTVSTQRALFRAALTARFGSRLRA